MKNFLALLLLISCVTSCSMKLDEIPEPANLIPKEKLVPLLEELMLVEFKVQSRYPQINQFQECAKKSGDYVLKKHLVSFKQFDETMDYYGSRQDEMEAIYDEVLENMNRKLNKLQAD